MDAATFDADDTTGGPDGTLTPDWGAEHRRWRSWSTNSLGNTSFLRAREYTRELRPRLRGGAVYDGTDTANQYTVFDPADRALGRTIDLGNRIYSDNP